MKIIPALMMLICASSITLNSPKAIAGDVETIMEQTRQNYIVPEYNSLRSITDKLALQIADLCKVPSPDSLEVVQNGFDDLVQQWARIEWLRLGPVMSENRLERFLFYPDRKGTGLRQVQRALGSKDEKVTNVENLSERSVAIQGLGALEFLLFEDGADQLSSAEPSTHRCLYAQAIVGNLNTISLELANAWGNGSQLSGDFSKTRSDSPMYRSDREALNALLGTMIHGLEAIRDIRIGSFLGAETQDDKATRAIFDRSEQTLETITAGIEGLETLFNKSGIEKVLPEESGSISDGVRFEFSQAKKTAVSLQDRPIQEVLNENDLRKQLKYLQLSIRYIIERLDTEFAPAAGLEAGFSFGDGD